MEVFYLDGMLFVCAALIALIAVVVALARYRRYRRRLTTLHRLLQDIDPLQASLRECRMQLQRAHAAMAAIPDLHTGDQSLTPPSMDASMRSLLQYRLWLRDCAATATQAELDAAVTAIAEARTQLQPPLQALHRAQCGLDSAVRERIQGNRQA